MRAIYNFFYLTLHRKNADKINIHDVQNPRILLMSDQSEKISPNMSALKKALIREGYKPIESYRAITTKHYNICHWIMQVPVSNPPATADLECPQALPHGPVTDSILTE